MVFPVSSGTAANGLSLGAMTPSYGTVFCHEMAHIVGSEAGSVEFYSGGGRLVMFQGELAKISAATLEAKLAGYGPAFLHQMHASTVSVTQATERGTVYCLDELAAIGEVARKANLKMHMDGARFANALARLDVSPAEMTWKSGIDILSLGTTKNGTMMAEAVIVFDRALAQAVRFKHKRAGFLQSKMRYFAAQLLAYVDNGLWLENARKANATAARLAKALSRTPGVELAFPVETNQIFVYLPEAVLKAFAAVDLSVRPWAGPKPGLYRMVASYCDPEALVARVEKALATVRKM
jgi:threonine aldolase